MVFQVKVDGIVVGFVQVESDTCGCQQDRSRKDSFSESEGRTDYASSASTSTTAVETTIV